MGEKGGLIRWLLLGLVVFLTIQVFGSFFGDDEAEVQPVYKPPSAMSKADETARPDERVCDIWTKEYRAQFSTHGAALKHFKLLTAKYQTEGKPLDLATTPDHEQMRQLYFNFRNAAAGGPDDEKWNVRYDVLTWKLTKSDAKSCEFTYRDDQVELKKVIRATRPYEISVVATIKNVAKGKLSHALTVESSAWRYESEVGGMMFRVSPFMTFVECIRKDRETTRLDPGEFEPDDFKEPPFAPTALNTGEWYTDDGAPAYAAVSNAYFSHALVPKGGGEPSCQLQVWNRKGTGAKSEFSGAFYRSRLAYPERELGPGASAEYSLNSYIGPKERDVLAAAGGVEGGLTELIDLGFFSVIAKVLVAFLLKVYSVIPNWGIAIIILTLTARTLLFPLSIPMIKNAMRMRELKPEMDALNEKFKDDSQQRGLAQMELWRKHGVSPFKGCLPQIASMPVWFALYTTLQTAVELYNIPFLWFPDLSAPDPFFVLPFVIGATTFIQQKLMPQQGDPAQQKMMLYFMPGMFTVFMLFLPSGLGVYMFTNGLIAIAQQQLVEWRVRKAAAAKKDGNGGEIQVKVKEDDTDDQSGASNKKRKKKRKGSKSRAA